MRAEVTLSEIAALLAVAQDHALGQPPGAQLRAVVLGQQLATAAGADRAEQETAKGYDPVLADVAIQQAAGWWEEAEEADPWDAALAPSPPSSPLDDATLHESLLILADFADLKSPWMGGHSRSSGSWPRQVTVAPPGPRSRLD